MGGISAAGVTDYFVLPLDLPQGARITRVTFNNIDNAAGTNLGFVTTYTPSTGDFTDLANGSSTGASAALQEMVLNTAIVVDNTTKSYNLLFAHGATGGAFVLAGATVEYTFNATLGAGGRPSLVSGSSE